MWSKNKTGIANKECERAEIDWFSYDFLWFFKIFIKKFHFSYGFLIEINFIWFFQSTSQPSIGNHIKYCSNSSFFLLHSTITFTNTYNKLYWTKSVEHCSMNRICLTECFEEESDQNFPKDLKRENICRELNFFFFWFNKFVLNFYWMPFIFNLFFFQYKI